jgi:chromosome partitioning protein
MVISVANEKGGVGKTTLAFQAAIALRMFGKDVLLIDADPQRSSADIAAVRSAAGASPDLSCVSLHGKGLAEEVGRLAKRYADIIIDVGGRDTAALRAALVCSDLVIIPILPSQVDAWTLETMSELVGQARLFNERLKAFVFVNKADANPAMRLADSVAEFAASLPNLSLLDTRLTYRVAHRRALAEGQAIFEMANADNKAVEELYALMEEVLCHA